MTNLTGPALYSAFAEQVYRRSYVKGSADQPIIVGRDGAPGDLPSDLSGWSLVAPSTLNIQNKGQSSLPSEFTVSGNYIYDIATGFVAMVAVNSSGQYVVTFRGVTVTVHSISMCRTRAQFNAFDNS
jgi:hypothetical protein